MEYKMEHIDGEEFTVIETKQFKMTIDEIKREIDQCRYHQDHLVKRSKEIKKEYDELSEKIKKLKEMLNNHTKESTLEIIEPTEEV